MSSETVVFDGQGEVVAAPMGDAERAFGWRVWLVPALLLVVLLAPLLRDGLPATRVGVVRVTAMAQRPSIVVGLPGEVDVKLSLAFWTGAAALAVAGLSYAVWARGVAWWGAALWLTLPLAASLVYQQGSISLLAGATFGVIGIAGVVSARGWARWVWAGLLVPGVALLWQGGPALYPFQLFSPAWPSGASAREWLNPVYALGLVPVVLAALVALVAWPRRGESEARRALVFIALAIAGAGLALVGGPVMLWLAVASGALVLAAAALPVLDRRFAALPVQLAIVAVSALTLLPALEPAWIDPVPPITRADSFGAHQLWLLDVQPRREGDEVIVEALWQVAAPLAQDVSAFVHLLDAQGTTVAQADALLLDADEVPTSRWPVGYVVRQTYRAPVPAAPTQLRLGLYDPPTLQRLPRDGGDDSVTVPIP